MSRTDGTAIIKDDAIIIRVPLKTLPEVVEGAWTLGALDMRCKLTDIPAFAKALVGALNDEDEEGTTLIHQMFDKAINDTLENGAEGIDEHEDQDE